MKVSSISKTIPHSECSFKTHNKINTQNRNSILKPAATFGLWFGFGVGVS